MILGYSTQDFSESKLKELLEIVTRQNTQWFLAELAEGRRPPLSSHDAGIKYCPDTAGQQIIFKDASDLLDSGVGSCGSIAAYDAAGRRAWAIHRRRTSPPVACGRYKVALIRRPGAENIEYWHAVVHAEGKTFDPTRALEQICPTPSYS